MAAIAVLQASDWSEAFATVMGAVFLIGLALVIVLNRFKRPDLDPRHAAHILTQLNTFGGTSGGSVVVRSTAALEDPDVVDTIRGLFHGERSDEPTVRAASRDAMGEVIGSVRAELRDRKPDVSKVPARAVQEAILTAVFGAIAVVPIAAWREATRTGDTIPDLPDFVSGTGVVLDSLITTATMFPFTDELFALGLTFGILGADTIWSLWMVPPVVLLALAGAYLWLERRVDTDRPVSGPPIRAWARRLTVLAVLTWATGASLAFIGALIPGPEPAQYGFAVFAALMAVYAFVFISRDPHPDPESPTGDDEPARTHEPAAPSERIHSKDVKTDEYPDPAPVRDQFRGVNWKQAALIGILAAGFAHPATALFAAFVVAAGVSVHWIRRTLGRWRTAARTHGRDALALDIVHSVTVMAGVLTLPLLIGYVLAAVGTGKVLAVGGVILAASSDTVLAVGVLAVVTALTLSVALLDQFRDVRRGLRRAMSVQSVRTVVFARALPVVFAGAIAVLLLGFGLNPVAAIAAALTAGVLARLAYMAFNHVSFRVRDRPERTGSASRVVISGRQVADADGDVVFVADVNGHRTAHRDLDPIVGQVRRDARSMLRNGRAETGSFPRYYFIEGVKRGNVDMDAVADELVGDIRTRFVANVKMADADADTILDKLTSEYPPHAVQKVVQSLKERGRVYRREDRFQWMGE